MHLKALDPEDIPPSCVPDCEGKDCGDDGCGGLCGVQGTENGCSSVFPHCNEDGLCEAAPPACIAECDGKDCGPDGCGGVCGDCTTSKLCVGGVCKTPLCDGQCGSGAPQWCGAGCKVKSKLISFFFVSIS